MTVWFTLCFLFLSFICIHLCYTFGRTIKIVLLSFIFRRLQCLPHTYSIRDTYRHNHVCVGRRRFLRNDVSRGNSGNFHVRPCVQDENFVGGSSTNDFCDNRCINGCTGPHDFDGRLLGHRCDQAESLQSLEVESRRSY